MTHPFLYTLWFHALKRQSFSWSSCFISALSHKQASVIKRLISCFVLKIREWRPMFDSTYRGSRAFFPPSSWRTRSNWTPRKCKAIRSMRSRYMIRALKLCSEVYRMEREDNRMNMRACGVQGRLVHRKPESGFSDSKWTYRGAFALRLGSTVTSGDR